MVEIVKKEVELRVFVLSRFDKKPVKKEITVLVHLNSGQNAREKTKQKKPTLSILNSLFAGIGKRVGWLRRVGWGGGGVGTYFSALRMV